MEETAFIFSRHDEEKSKNKPSMVIIFSKNRISAIGDPATFASVEADQILKQYSFIEPSEIPSVLEQYRESYGGVTFAYGGSVEIVKYEGSAKNKVDTIRDTFLNSRVDRTLGRTQGQE